MILKSIIQQGSGTSKSSLERLILGVAPKVVRKPPRISSLCTRLREPSEYLSYSVGTAAQLELYFFLFPNICHIYHVLIAPMISSSFHSISILSFDQRRRHQCQKRGRANPSPLSSQERTCQV